MKYEMEKFYRNNKNNVDSAGFLIGAVVLYKMTGWMIIPGFIFAFAVNLWRKR